MAQLTQKGDINGRGPFESMPVKKKDTKNSK